MMIYLVKSNNKLINNNIINVTADPKANGGVSSAVKSLIASNIYGNKTSFIHPHSEGNLLLKIFVLIKALCLFTLKCIFLRPEFVHIHTSSYNSFKRKYNFIKICQLLKIKYLVHIHGGGFVSFYNEESKMWQRNIVTALKGAKTVISISPASRKELEQCFTINNCRVIPNFVTGLPNIKVSLEDVIKKKKNLSILFLGDISDNKGFEDAVKVISEVRKNYPYIVLNCAGKQDINYFNSVINKYHAKGFINYHGFVKSHKKIQLMVKALFILSPSKIETFGMSNLESALMGTPALAYAVGGVPFVINSGKSGYLATLGDWPSLVEPILKYIASDNDYLILQQTCIKDMQSKFSIDSISNKYQKLYQ